MKLLSLLALPAVAFAWNDWKNGNCLSDADAQSIVDRSIIYLQHKDIPLANATAYGLFTSDIQEFGDSINALRGDPLGTQVENGITTYVQDTLSTPPIDEIDTLMIIHDCKNILWQWRFIGIGPERVQGMTIIKTNDEKKVYYQYVEFNSLTWATDIGFMVTPPAGGGIPGGN